MEKGKIIDYWEDGAITAGAFVEEAKGRIRVLSPGGRFSSITESRIMHVSDRAVPVEESERASALLKEYEAEASRMSESLDLSLVWELLSAEEGGHEIREIASLLLDSEDGLSRSAVLRALTGDSIHFIRKDQKFYPKSPEAVEEALKRLRAEERKARAREKFLEILAACIEGKSKPAALPPEVDYFLSLLRELAVQGPQAPRLKEASALVDGLRERFHGIPPETPGQTAFWILRTLGVFGEDENLFLLRAGVPVAFSSAVLEEAEQVAREGLRSLHARSGPVPALEDYRGVDLFSIDDEETTEVDDALSLQTLDAGRPLYRVGVHIADLAHFIAPGTTLDEEALARSTTIYLPEQKILMIPASLSEGAASLKRSEDRPALSFVADVTGAGTVERFSIHESIVRISRRLSYAEVDRILEDGQDPLREILGILKGLADRWMARRMEGGALVVKAKEPDIRVLADGTIDLRILDPGTPARLLVSEMMILANRLTAEFLSENKVPVIFRLQPSPDSQSSGVGSIIDKPHEVFAARRTMKPVNLSLRAGTHWGLGLNAYLQVTSPLRRYQDLTVHRQLKTYLRGAPLQYSEDDLRRIAATTEEAERTARMLERNTEEYWILKYLAGKEGQVLEAVVVHSDQRRSLIQLSDLPYIAPLLPSPTHFPGTEIRVILEEVNPRLAKIILREC